MNRQRQFPTWFGALLGTISALLALALGAHASDHRGALTEEFHQTYALTPDGRVELDNINGAVHISTWDQNEVKVDAVKYADSKERLAEARIKVDSGKEYLSIHTEYPGHDHTFTWGSHNNPAEVEYTLTVPRTARLDEIKLINGSLDVMFTNVRPLDRNWASRTVAPKPITQPAADESAAAFALPPTSGPSRRGSPADARRACPSA